MMKIIKVEAGTYRTMDERYTIQSDYTSANGGMKLAKCWKVIKYGWVVKTCKTIGEAKDFVKLQYA